MGISPLGSVIKLILTDFQCSLYFGETKVKNFFVQYFPRRYGFTSGYLVDKDENISNQLDWIIFDATYFSPLMGKAQLEDSIEWLPFDAAYGSIEVKRTLDEDSLEKAVRQIEKTKNLKRDPVDLLQVNPLLHFSKKQLNIPEEYKLPICNYYYSGIYAYSLNGFDDGNTIIDYILSLGIHPKNLPDFIAVHGRFFIKRVKNSENEVEITPFADQTNAYGVIESGVNTSGIFYSDLITQFANTKLSASYQMDLVQNIIRELGLIKIKGRTYPNVEKRI